MPRALVADDHALFRAALVAVLKSDCMIDDVAEAENLDDALEKLDQDRTIDIAIFDLGMPGMQAVASLAAIRDAFPNVKVVVLTASTRRQDMLSALEYGLHGFIPKTLGSEGIAQALRYVLGGDIYAPRELAMREGDGDGASLTAYENLGRLSPRQREVLKRLVTGEPNKVIARALGVSENTIKVHANAVYRTFGVNNRRDLAASIGKESIPPAGIVHSYGVVPH